MFRPEGALISLIGLEFLEMAWVEGSVLRRLSLPT
jgi:hypothetical protein